MQDILETLHQQHQQLDDYFLQHQVTLIDKQVEQSMVWFGQFTELLAQHLLLEEQTVFPKLSHISEALWPASLYLKEHDKLRELAKRSQDKLQELANIDSEQLSLAILKQLEYEHKLKHVLEHHQQREEQGVFAELLM